MNTKQCGICNKTKPLSEFYDKKRSKVRIDGTIHKWVGKYSACKKCTNDYNSKNIHKYKSWFKQYRKDNKENISKRTKANYIKNKLEWINLISLKKEIKCSMCGYDKAWAALEFHHLDPTIKKFTIHSMVNSVPTEERWEKMQIELDKCVVICSNCHREIHSKYDFLNMIRGG